LELVSASDFLERFSGIVRTFVRKSAAGLSRRIRNLSVGFFVCAV
jgi:hypothetical protein